MRRYMGDILLDCNDQRLSEAEELIREAIKYDIKNRMSLHLGRDYALYSELFKRKNDLPKAKENLRKAIEIIENSGANGWVEKYERELSALS